MIVTLLSAAAVVMGLLWIFQPTIHYFESVNVGTMGYRDFTMFDKYTNAVRSSNQKPVPVGLSVVVPAYNEELRLGSMLEVTLSYLDKYSAAKKFTYEIIVVDDGSKDMTLREAKRFMQERSTIIRVLQLHENRGKGAALKIGVRESLGHVILIADADAATEISDFSRLLESLLNNIGPIPESDIMQKSVATGRAVVVGSRAHLAKESVNTRAFYRTVLMKGFHFYVQLLVTRHVEDTQCGFKLFTRSVANDLFGSLHLYRWAFDTELIYLAEYLKVPIFEVPVNWREVDGSKLIQTKFDVITTSLTMARDILCMRLSYLFGLWKYPVRAKLFENNELDQDKTYSKLYNSSASNFSLKAPVENLPGQLPSRNMNSEL